MFIRVLTSLIIFIFSINLVSAATMFDPILKVLGQEGILGIVIDPDGMGLLGIYLICIYIVFYTLLRLLLKPVFRGHSKEINVIAGAISVIGTSGLFWMFKGDNITDMLYVFGGTTAVILVSIIVLLVINGVDSIYTNLGGERFSKGWYFWISLFITLGIYLITASINKIQEGLSPRTSFAFESFVFVLNTISTISILVVLVTLILAIKGDHRGLSVSNAWSKGKKTNSKYNPYSKENIQKKKEVEKTKDITDEISKDIVEIEEILNDINQKIGVNAKRGGP